MAPSKDFDNFRTLLRSSKHIIAVAGAGLSAASGIPTFRGTGGMWRKYDAFSLATPEGFAQSPSLVWQFYHYRRQAALAAQPNRAHLALSFFSLPAARNQIVPGSTFTLITQNVDGLSARSDQEPPILEMHGRLFDLLCTNRKCKHVEFNAESPICEGLAGTEMLIETKTTDPNIELEDLPRCSKCGALGRPGVVWFGETPHHLDTIDGLVAQADLCLVIGTSSKVYPAASYAEEVKRHGGKVAVFNVEHSHGDSKAHYLFPGPCEETLPKALGLSISVDRKITIETPA
ncbi:DHS-like NAD/FAD-binding domain-containing protein [Gymnopilus junonius]|uniref:NAD-dependent protein deacylase n=1 Tax=Gymnopilus junonius TaxID=109634 RepID=A0A9P5NP98_GYMJU|nr:DHS-like NAD/FAD-binding domain-containing protein [Gymnopilus junonius]